MVPTPLAELSPCVMRAHRWRCIDHRLKAAWAWVRDQWFPFYGSWTLLTIADGHLRLVAEDGRQFRLGPDECLLVDGARLRVTQGRVLHLWRLDFELAPRLRMPTRDPGGFRPVDEDQPHPDGRALLGQDLTLHLRGDEGRVAGDRVRSICDLWWREDLIAGPPERRFLLANGHLAGLLAELLEACWQPEELKLDDPLIAHARRMARRSFDYGLTVERLAGMVGLGLTAFTTRFRRACGTGPGAFLRDLRYDAAIRLLRRHPDRPLDDLIVQCGFQSVQSFVSGFRRRYGQTPDRWRASDPESATGGDQDERNS